MRAIPRNASCRRKGRSADLTESPPPSPSPQGGGKRGMGCLAPRVPKDSKAAVSNGTGGFCMFGGRGRMVPVKGLEPPTHHCELFFLGSTLAGRLRLREGDIGTSVHALVSRNRSSDVTAQARQYGVQCDIAIESRASARFTLDCIICQSSAPELASRRLEAPFECHGWQGQRAILHGRCG